MSYIATRESVSNRGRPPESFLDQLIAWGKTAPDEIFQWMPDADRPDDVYSHVFKILGPYTAGVNRKAVMLEIMRVLAGFESSWNWNEGHHRPKDGMLVYWRRGRTSISGSQRQQRLGTSRVGRC